MESVLTAGTKVEQSDSAKHAQKAQNMQWTMTKEGLYRSSSNAHPVATCHIQTRGCVRHGQGRWYGVHILTLDAENTEAVCPTHSHYSALIAPKP